MKLKLPCVLSVETVPDKFHRAPLSFLCIFSPIAASFVRQAYDESNTRHLSYPACVSPTFSLSAPLLPSPGQMFWTISRIPQLRSLPPLPPLLSR